MIRNYKIKIPLAFLCFKIYSFSFITTRFSLFLLIIWTETKVIQIDLCWKAKLIISIRLCWFQWRSLPMESIFGLVVWEQVYVVIQTFAIKYWLSIFVEHTILGSGNTKLSETRSQFLKKNFNSRQSSGRGTHINNFQDKRSSTMWGVEMTSWRVQRKGITSGDSARCLKEMKQTSKTRFSWKLRVGEGEGNQDWVLVWGVGTCHSWGVVKNEIRKIAQWSLHVRPLQTRKGFLG